MHAGPCSKGNTAVKKLHRYVNTYIQAYTHGHYLRWSSLCPRAFGKHDGGFPACICICMYIYIYIAYVFVCMYGCRPLASTMGVFLHVYANVNRPEFGASTISMCVCVCVCVYIYIYIYIYIYMYV